MVNSEANIVSLEGERDSDAADMPDGMEMPDAMEMPRSPLFESGAFIREGDSNAVQEVDKLDYAEVQNFIKESRKNLCQLLTLQNQRNF